MEATVKLQGKSEDILALVQMALESGLSIEFSTSESNGISAPAKKRQQSARKPKYSDGDLLEVTSTRTEYKVEEGWRGEVQSSTHLGKRGNSYELKGADDSIRRVPESILRKVRK